MVGFETSRLYSIASPFNPFSTPVFLYQSPILPGAPTKGNAISLYVCSSLFTSTLVDSVYYLS